MLPVGVNKSDFEGWLDNINIKGRPALTKALNGLTDMFDNDYQLHYAGQGKYFIVDQNNGNPTRVMGEDGKAFILDYNKREEYR